MRLAHSLVTVDGMPPDLLLAAVVAELDAHDPRLDKRHSPYVDSFGRFYYTLDRAARRWRKAQAG